MKGRSGEMVLSRWSRLILVLFMALAMTVIISPHNVFAEGEGVDEGDDIDWKNAEYDVEENTDKLYSDGLLTFRIHNVQIPDGISEGDIKVTVARNGNWEDHWDMNTEGLYSFEEAGSDLIFRLNGAAAAKAGAAPYERVMMSVLCDDCNETDPTIYWSIFAEFEYREARVEYDIPQDRNILPGWDGSIDGRLNVYVENAEHPDGEWLDINDVEVESVDGADEVFDDHHRDSDEGDENNHWYYYHARDIGEAVYGTAIFTISYTDIEGVKQTCKVNINVVSDVYSADVRSETGGYNGLPGAEITMSANAKHDYYKELGDGRFEYTSDNEGLRCEWNIEEGSEYAVLTPDAADPARAVIRFKDLSSDQEYINENIRVSVKVYGGEGTEADAYNDAGFRVMSDYTEIWPANSDMPVGLVDDLMPGDKIQNQKFEVRQFSINGSAEEGYNENGYRVIGAGRELAYCWSYDTNCLRITDSNGVIVPDGEEVSSDTFTIKRLREWDTDFNLHVMWTESNDDESSERDCWQNYHIFGSDCNIWDTEHDQEIYNDAAASPSVVFGADLGDNWQERLDVVVKAGTWDNDEWSDVLPESEYTIDKTDDSITVRLNKDLINGYTDDTSIRIFAEVYVKGEARTDDSRLTAADSWIHIHTARTYFDREEDCDLLASHDEINVQKSYNVYIENSAHPDGEDLEYEVTNVEIASETPDKEGTKVIRDFRKDYENGDTSSDNYWWHMEAARTGKAVIKVFYKLPAGIRDELGTVIDAEAGTGYYEFTANVTEDVYDVWVSTEDGRYRGIPGDTFKLIAEASHRTRNGDTTEGITYEWSITSGSEFADVKPDEKDPSIAVVTLKLPDGYDTEHGYWEDIDAECSIYDGTDNAGKPVRRASETVRLNITESYFELIPTSVEDVEIGDSVTVTPEIRRYPGTDGKEYDTVSGVSYEWYYDSNAVIIKDAEGNTVGNTDSSDKYVGSTEPQKFTVTRLREWGTDIRLEARWNDDDNEQQENTNYWLRDKHYDISCREHDVHIASDDLNIPELIFNADLGNNWSDRFDLDITVGTWNIETDAWTEVYKQGTDYTIRMTDDEIGITLSENQVREDTDYKDVRAEAAVYLKGAERTKDNRITQDDAWLHIFRPAVDYNDNLNIDMTKDDYIEIPDYSYAWVRNSEYPDGGFEKYSNTGVEITKNTDNAVVMEKPGSDSNSWKITAVGYGDAEAVISYIGIDGNPGTRTYHIHVLEEVYEVTVSEKNDLYQMTPGSAADLTAVVNLHKEGNQKEDVTDNKDLSYEWTLTDGNEYAVLTPDGNKASLKFNESDSDEEFYEYVRVRVVVRNGEEEVGNDEYEFRYVNEFDRIANVDIDRNLGIGESVRVTPEIRHYPSDAAAGYDVFSDAGYEWDYDKNVVSITKDGDSYVITRLSGEETGIQINASWVDNEGYERWTGEWYFLDEIECEHSWDAGKVTKDATCTEAGKMTYTCTKCGATKTEVIKAKGHTEEVIPAVAATCTETGLTAGKKCSVCGEILEEQKVVPAFGHDWGDWKVVKEATEDAEGLERRVCSRDASHTEERVIPKLQHVHDLKKTEATSATCTKDGNIEYWTCSKCGKIYSDAEGKTEITEAETVVKATGHTEEVIPAVAATCTETGLTAGKKCSVCGEILEEQKVVPALGHDWGDWKVVKEATTSAEGLKERTCKTCGAKETQTIPVVEKPKQSLGIKNLWASQHSVGKVLFKWTKKDDVTDTGWVLKYRTRKIGAGGSWSGWTFKEYPAGTYQAWVNVKVNYVIEIHAQAKGDTTWSTGIITTPAGGKYQAMKTTYVMNTATKKRLTGNSITIKKGQSIKVKPDYEYSIKDYKKRPKLYPTQMLYDVTDKSVIQITKPDKSVYTGGMIDGIATITGTRVGTTRIVFRAPNGRTQVFTILVK